MAFERFDHIRKGFDPKASLSTSGRISLNEGAIRQYELGKFKFASLLYDKEDKLIGIELSEKEKHSSSFKLQFRENSGFFISALSFMKYYNIVPKTTGFYELSQDDDNKAFLKINLKTKTEWGEKSKQSK